MTHTQNRPIPPTPLPQPFAQAAKSPITFAKEDPSSIALAKEDQPLVAANSHEAGLAAPKSYEGGLVAPKSYEGGLVTPKSYEGGPTESQLMALQFSAAPLQSLQTRPAPKPRNGKIAHLPKLERDMVNRMLANNLPHRKIVEALDECDFQVTERNVSNWKTHGGYKEWCAAQAHALELRAFQDNLTEFLRRHDAAELPEVGLQSAATSLSAILLRPDLIRQLISEPEKYSKLIEIQCRLAREIQALQKNRDDAAKSLGYKFNPERLKRQNEEDVELIRLSMSSKIGNSIREPDIPHRNFIPRELEPVPPTLEPLGLAALQTFKAALAGHHAASSPPADKPQP
jgi:hypothetical protein